MLHKVGVGVCRLLLIAVYAPAQIEPPERTAKYQFTTILNSKRDGLEPTRCAAMNTQGIVTVQVRDPALGVKKLIIKRTANDAPMVILDTRSIADFPTFCDNGIVSIPYGPKMRSGLKVQG